jgi:uncharacterized protein YutD
MHKKIGLIWLIKPKVIENKLKNINNIITKYCNLQSFVLFLLNNTTERNKSKPKKSKKRSKKVKK